MKWQYSTELQNIRDKAEAEKLENREKYWKMGCLQPEAKYR